MNLTRLMTAVAATALLAGAAHAQTTDSSTATESSPATTASDTNTSTTTTTDDSTTAPAADTGTASDTSADAGLSVNDNMSATTGAEAATSAGVPASSMTTTMNQAPGTVTASVVTNGPIPDTAENRAKYGQPLSRAGKRTTAKGN